MAEPVSAGAARRRRTRLAYSRFPAERATLRAANSHNGFPMRSIAHAAAALAVLAAASPALAQSQPGDGSLMINPDARQWAFRAAGVPWICMADGRCSQIRFDGVSPGLIAAAEVAGLGFAGEAYFLAL